MPVFNTDISTSPSLTNARNTLPEVESSHPGVTIGMSASAAANNQDSSGST